MVKKWMVFLLALFYSVSLFPAAAARSGVATISRSAPAAVERISEAVRAYATIPSSSTSNDNDSDNDDPQSDSAPEETPDDVVSQEKTPEDHGELSSMNPFGAPMPEEDPWNNDNDSDDDTLEEEVLPTENQVAWSNWLRGLIGLKEKHVLTQEGAKKLKKAAKESKPKGLQDLLKSHKQPESYNQNLERGVANHLRREKNPSKGLLGILDNKDEDQKIITATSIKHQNKKQTQKSKSTQKKDVNEHLADYKLPFGILGNDDDNDFFSEIKRPLPTPRSPLLHEREPTTLIVRQEAPVMPLEVTRSTSIPVNVKEQAIAPYQEHPQTIKVNNQNLLDHPRTVLDTFQHPDGVWRIHRVTQETNQHKPLTLDSPAQELIPFSQTTTLAPITDQTEPVFVVEIDENALAKLFQDIMGARTQYSRPQNTTAGMANVLARYLEEATEQRSSGLVPYKAQATALVPVENKKQENKTTQKITVDRKSLKKLLDKILETDAFNPGGKKTPQEAAQALAPEFEKILQTFYTNQHKRRAPLPPTNQSTALVPHQGQPNETLVTENDPSVWKRIRKITTDRQDELVKLLGGSAGAAESVHPRTRHTGLKFIEQMPRTAFKKPARRALMPPPAKNTVIKVPKTAPVKSHQPVTPVEAEIAIPEVAPKELPSPAQSTGKIVPEQPNLTLDTFQHPDGVWRIHRVTQETNQHKPLTLGSPAQELIPFSQTTTLAPITDQTEPVFVVEIDENALAKLFQDIMGARTQYSRAQNTTADMANVLARYLEEATKQRSSDKAQATALVPVENKKQENKTTQKITVDRKSLKRLLDRRLEADTFNPGGKKTPQEAAQALAPEFEKILQTFYTNQHKRRALLPPTNQSTALVPHQGQPNETLVTENVPSVWKRIRKITTDRQNELVKLLGGAASVHPRTRQAARRLIQQGKAFMPRTAFKKPTQRALMPPPAKNTVIKFPETAPVKPHQAVRQPTNNALVVQSPKSSRVPAVRQPANKALVVQPAARPNALVPKNSVNRAVAPRVATQPNALVVQPPKSSPVPAVQQPANNALIVQPAARPSALVPRASARPQVTRDARNNAARLADTEATELENIRVNRDAQSRIARDQQLYRAKEQARIEAVKARALQQAEALRVQQAELREIINANARQRNLNTTRPPVQPRRTQATPHVPPRAAPQPSQATEARIVQPGTVAKLRNFFERIAREIRQRIQRVTQPARARTDRPHAAPRATPRPRQAAVHEAQPRTLERLRNLFNEFATRIRQSARRITQPRVAPRVTPRAAPRATEHPVQGTVERLRNFFERLFGNTRRTAQPPRFAPRTNQRIGGEVNPHHEPTNTNNTVPVDVPAPPMPVPKPQAPPAPPMPLPTDSSEETGSSSDDEDSPIDTPTDPTTEDEIAPTPRSIEEEEDIQDTDSENNNDETNEDADNNEDENKDNNKKNPGITENKQKENPKVKKIAPSAPTTTPVSSSTIAPALKRKSLGTRTAPSPSRTIGETFKGFTSPVSDIQTWLQKRKTPIVISSLTDRSEERSIPSKFVPIDRPVKYQQQKRTLKSHRKINTTNLDQSTSETVTIHNTKNWFTNLWETVELIGHKLAHFIKPFIFWTKE